MDPTPEDIAAALAGNKTVAEPGAPVTGHLWNEYWKEVGRWAPWMALAVPPAVRTANAPMGSTGSTNVSQLSPETQEMLRRLMDPQNMIASRKQQFPLKKPDLTVIQGGKDVLTPAANPSPMNLDALTQMLRTISGKTPPANTE